jgi:hypothetical protein
MSKGRPPRARWRRACAPPAPPCHPREIDAGNRLTHLLLYAGRSPAAPGGGPDATMTHLQALEDEVTIPVARLDSLAACVATRPESQQFQILQAVAALIDERLGRWR